MKNTITLILLIIPMLAWGQEERKYIRDGYKAYMNESFNDAEVDFRKAEEAAPESYVARYNTGTSLYQQSNMEESGKRFTELLNEASDPAEQARLHHNIGNVKLEEKKYQEAADAYKKSLKLNPNDEDTRYNLSYALEKLREQQQQQQNQDQNKDQNQDQNKDQNKDQEKSDDQKQDKQQDQEDKSEQQNQDQQKQEEEKGQQEQKQKMKLSKDEAERLLNAILQKEKDVKEEVDKKKAAGAKIKSEKDW